MAACLAPNVERWLLSRELRRISRKPSQEIAPEHRQEVDALLGHLCTGDAAAIDDFMSDKMEARSDRLKSIGAGGPGPENIVDQAVRLRAKYAANPVGAWIDIARDSGGGDGGGGLVLKGVHDKEDGGGEDTEADEVRRVAEANSTLAFRVAMQQAELEMAKAGDPDALARVLAQAAEDEARDRAAGVS